MPTARQRLIFRGKLLKDNEALSEYKIEDSDVVHLVAKTGEQVESGNMEESAMNNDSNNTRSNRREASFFSIMNRLIRLDNEQEGSGGSVLSSRPSIIPAVMSRRVRRGPLSQENVSQSSDFNSIECRETIFQNFASLNNLIECGTASITNTCNTMVNNIGNNISNISNSNIFSNSSDSESSERRVDLFDFKKKKLIKGQWVDVRDTIEQWLEAQVIDVRENEVYIHYNGWGTRWDEWISMDSDRIRPFRFHTRQNTHSNYQSPFPSVKPDANLSLESNLSPQESFFEIFDEMDRYYSYARDMMNQIKIKRREHTPEAQKDIYRISKSLTPFLDKFGRSITDIGGYINQSMRNNKLEDLDKKLFDNKNLDPSLKPYEYSEMLRVELEETARRNRRESGANILNPVNSIDRSITSQVSF